MVNPLVTVIIPAFNAEGKIGRCIESVLGQDYKNIEVFVVDDGSKDDTGKVIESYARKDKRVKFLQQNRKGPGAAKNFAASKAKGKILVFVDSDEYPRKDYVTKLTKPLREGKAKTSIGAWYVANPRSPWARCRFPDSHALRQHALKSGVFRAIRKDFFVKLGGFDITKGYSDDRIPNDDKRARVDAIFDHDVDSSLKEIYQKRKWIGSSIMKNPKNAKFKLKLLAGIAGIILLILSLIYSITIFWILIILILIPIAYKALAKTIFYRDLRLIFYYPLYSIACGIAMTAGFLKPVYKNRK